MVPEVDAARERPQQGVAYGQARSHAHACGAHRLPMLGADDCARAEVIGHGPTGHAAGSRTLQGLDDLAAVIVRQPDVEQHMDVIRCGIDVGHHGVDRSVGVWQKARCVATHGMEPADRVTEPKEMPVTLGNGGCEVRRVPSGGTRDWRHALEDCVQPLHAATANVHLAQEEIGEHAKQRQHANDHHPCDSGSRVAMGSKQDPRDDRQFEQRDERDSEQRVVERCDHGGSTVIRTKKYAGLSCGACR